MQRNITTPTLLTVLLLTAVGCSGGGGGGSDDAPDTTPPVVTLTFPPPRSMTNAGTLTVRGTATDRSRVTAVRVNGVEATSDDDFATWTARVLLHAGESTIRVDAEDSKGNFAERSAVAEIEVGPILSGTSAVALDPERGRALIGNRSVAGNFSILSVDLATGVRTMLSSATLGAGPPLLSATSILVDRSRNRLLVVDSVAATVVAVDPASGERTVVAELAPTGRHPIVRQFRAILDEAANRLLVVDNFTASLFSIDLATGASQVISGLIRGAGVPLQSPVAVALDASMNRAVVLDNRQVGFLVGVDLASGDRTLLSGNGLRGLGPDFDYPADLAIGNPGEAIVLMKRYRSGVGFEEGNLLSVDLASGWRRPLTQACPDGRPRLVDPVSLAWDANTDEGIVSDAGLLGLIPVGRFTDCGPTPRVISDSAIGSGPRLSYAGLVTLDRTPNRAFVLSGFCGGGDLIAVDLESSGRSAVATRDRASGCARPGPLNGSFVLDALRDRLIRTDDFGRLVSVDRVTGQQTTFYDGYQDGYGPVSVAIDPAHDRAVVLDFTHFEDPSVYGLSFVDLSTGVRADLPRGSSSAGPDLVAPRDLVVGDGGRRAWIVDRSLEAVISVNLVSGERRVVSSDHVGSGPPLVRPSRIALADSHHAVIVSGSADGSPALLLVNLDTGDRSIASGRTTGSGPRLESQLSICVDDRKRAIVVDRDWQAVFVVDLTTGDRVIVSR